MLVIVFQLTIHTRSEAPTVLCASAVSDEYILTQTLRLRKYVVYILTQTLWLRKYVVFQFSLVAGQSKAFQVDLSLSSL
jgi:hypothetical protein